MNLQDFVHQITQMQTCKKCSSRYNSTDKISVRIGTCGHYFCAKCLYPNSGGGSKVCPECNSPYKFSDLTKKNTYSCLNEPLNELKQQLSTVLQNKSPTPKQQLFQSTDQASIISYEDKSYEMRYIDMKGKVNAKGEGILHGLIQKENTQKVQMCLEAEDVDINAKDYAGWTPLHEAVVVENLDIVKLLLSKGALVDVPGTNYSTALHIAAGKNAMELVTVLYKNGASLDAVDYDGRKPIECVHSDFKAEFRKITSTIVTNKQQFVLFLPKNIRAYCHSITKETMARLSVCKGVKIFNTFDVEHQKLTHFFIKKTHTLSLKILLALAGGLQFAPEEWIVDCLANGNCSLPIPNYSFINDENLNKAIQKSTMNSLLNRPKIFSGISFFIQDHVNPCRIHSLNVDKAFLSLLIKTGGGIILRRAPATRTIENGDKFPYHAKKPSKLMKCNHYVIYQEEKPPAIQYNMAELQSRPSTWLINCLLQFEFRE